MPGAGCRERRRNKRQRVAAAAASCEATAVQQLYRNLWALPRADLSVGAGTPGSHLPDGQRWETVAWRIGAAEAFGGYGTLRRQAVVDNFCSAVVREIGADVRAVQFLPDPSQRASPSAIMVAVFEAGAESWAQTSRTVQVWVRTLSDGRVVPGLGDRFFDLRRQTAGPLHPVVPDSERDSSPIALIYRSYLPTIPDPDNVTVKIRGLHPDLHRPGAMAAFLQASGYPDAGSRIVREYHPVWCPDPASVTSACALGPPPLGTRQVTCPRNFSVLAAEVVPPPDDPGLSKAAQWWSLPGHPQRVKVSVALSQARMVSGARPPPLPPPIARVPEQVPFFAPLPDQMPCGFHEGAGYGVWDQHADLADIMRGLTVQHDRPGTSRAARTEAVRAMEVAQLNAILDRADAETDSEGELFGDYKDSWDYDDY